MTDDVPAVNEWVVRYKQAWETNDPAEIGVLFSEDAEYFPKPSSTPWVSRDQIVERWLDRKDEPGTWTFEHKVLIAGPALGIVRGVTTYSSGTVYDNLWEIYLDAEGRASRFVEWWVER